LNITFGKISNTKATDVVLTAGRDQDHVEVAEAYRTAVLIDFSLIFICWVEICELDLFLADLSFNSHFASLPDFILERLNHFIWIVDDLKINKVLYQR